MLIVSTGRTGTKFLAHLLAAASPEVEAHHTTPWSTLVNVLGNLELAGLVSERVVLATWRLLKGRRFAVTERARYVDSNNHLYAFARLAPRLYPGVRVVHVVRDPRDYVRSHLNWARQRAKSFVANHCLPFWQPNPFLAGEMPLARTLALGRFERFCWIWRFKNQRIAALAGAGIPYLCLRFEDLVADRDRARERLLDFVGVPAPDAARAPAPGRLNPTRRRAFPGWRRWPATLCARLDALCGADMIAYGYGGEREWRLRLRLGRAHWGIA